MKPKLLRPRAGPGPLGPGGSNPPSPAIQFFFSPLAVWILTVLAINFALFYILYPSPSLSSTEPRSSTAEGPPRPLDAVRNTAAESKKHHDSHTFKPQKETKQGAHQHLHQHEGDRAELKPHDEGLNEEAAGVVDADLVHPGGDDLAPPVADFDTTTSGSSRKKPQHHQVVVGKKHQELIPQNKKKDNGNGEGLKEEGVLEEKEEQGGGFYTRDRIHGYQFLSLEDMLKKTTTTAKAGQGGGGLKDTMWQPTVEEKPELYSKAIKLKEFTGCDVLTVPFNPKNDQQCIDFLVDTKNWKELRPIDQKFDERTIKFKIFFDVPETDPKDGKPIHPLATILKVPQRGFTNEAFSEVASYHADRVLQVNRIPPTGWVCIPSRLIHAGVKKYGPRLEVVEEFLQESHVKNFEEWIEKDLFQFASREGLLKKKKMQVGHKGDEINRLDQERGGGGDQEETEGGKEGGDEDATLEECVGASIQLFMADVGHLLDSTLKIPYIPHDAGWMKHFDLRDIKAGEAPKFVEKNWAVSMIHLSELAMFDYVLGNGDRSPNKNNFVVGGCNRQKYCSRKSGELSHPGYPTYVHLDQGMGFYGTPRRNPIATLRKEGKMCIFSTPLLNRIKELSEMVPLDPADPGAADPTRHHSPKERSKFHVLMREAMPVDVMDQVRDQRLESSTERIGKLLRTVDKCLSDGEGSFKPWVLAP